MIIPINGDGYFFLQLLKYLAILKCGCICNGYALMLEWKYCLSLTCDSIKIMMLGILNNADQRFV